jgi:oligopeptide/dipeptide ABC transporter ATP-binding protein
VSVRTEVATAPPALLAGRGLVKAFRARDRRAAATTLALAGVDVAIAAGEAVGLAGESGSGKTTLGRVLVGLERPTAGVVTIDGRPVRGIDRRVQMVFQDPTWTLDPRLVAADAVREALAMRGADPGEAAALLAAVGLPTDLARRYPHELSGGQRQRVGIARALAAAPLALVLDEPTSALDVLVQAQILALLGRLRAERGLGYLVISHDLSVLSALTDRLMVMYRGRVVEEGPTTAVLAQPRHPYTRALLAAVPDPSPAAAWRPAPLPVRAVRSGGCAFAARCPIAVAACEDAAPPLAPSGDGRAVACFVAAADAGATPPAALASPAAPTREETEHDA